MKTLEFSGRYILCFFMILIILTVNNSDHYFAPCIKESTKLLDIKIVITHVRSLIENTKE